MKNKDSNIIEVKPQPSVYTVLIIIAILFLGAATYFVGQKLTAKGEAGYGMTVGQMLKNPAEYQPAEMRKVEAQARREATQGK